MSKVSLKEWASIAEIIASVGVMISLIFLAYSINRNSEMLQSANDNMLFQIRDAQLADAVNSPHTLPIQLKLANGEGLTQIEQARHSWNMIRNLNAWETAFYRHRDGFLAAQIWETWDRGFETEVILAPYGLPKEVWDTPGWGDTYGIEFQDHVDAAYARRSKNEN